MTASTALAPPLSGFGDPVAAPAATNVPRSVSRAAPGARTLVVWCPDWPAVAAARQTGLPVTGPAAVFHANRVQACTAAARAEGIRVHMRRRDAQSRCPELAVLPVDTDRDARLFESVAAAVEAIAPGVEVLRPGLVACQIRGPARYFGSETAAAERIVDAVESLDVECHIGIAGVLPIAVLAARQSTIVPPGGDGEFCAGLPIVELSRDPAIAPPERVQLVDLLLRLGITTAGAFASLPADKVATRFGPDGVVMHRLASGWAERGLSRRRIDADLSVEQSCDPPLDRVDTAAFAARALAERFHARLAAAGLACTRLVITASTERGATLTRIWRCVRPLTAAATADRLRWQLDGWLTGSARPAAFQPPGMGDTPGDPGGWRGADGVGSAGGSGGPGAITRLRLEPIEAIGAGLIQYGLWGSDGLDDHRAGWAFARVQGLLGPDAVLSPVLSGGRGPADRITLAAWGQEKAPERDPSAPWPGALPSPAPATSRAPAAPHGPAAPRGPAASRGGPAAPRTPAAPRGPAAPDAARSSGAGAFGATGVPRYVAATASGVTGSPGRSATVTVTDRAGHEVAVTDRGLLTAPPAAVAGSPVLSWAGPWLLDERWWAGGDPVTAPAERRARLQVITDDGPPVLLGYGTSGWSVEAVYD